MIEIDSVTHVYGQTAAIRDLSLVFARGRTTALVGPSGCGKSTLLRILLGLVQPSHGRVVADGRDIATIDRQTWLRNIGYVVQDGGLFPHLDARDNVTLVARHLRLSSADIARRLAELAALLQYPAELLGRRPHELSGGQRQRVSLMRALMLDPTLLLLDEPLGALDPITRRRLQDELRTLFARVAKTVVLVTHDMNEAARLADEVVLMRAGAVVQHGPFHALLQAPEDPYVTEFINAQGDAVGELVGKGQPLHDGSGTA